jgi:hypothetical protein
MENLKFIEFWKTGENPITCYISRPNLESDVKVPKKTKKIANNSKQGVTIVDDKGKQSEYQSVVEAAASLQMNKSTLYSVLNGYRDNPTNYQIFKSNFNS